MPKNAKSRVAGEDRRTGSEPRQDRIDFRQFLDRLPSAAYTCDADGLITYCNRAAVELWGRSPKLNDPIDRF